MILYFGDYMAGFTKHRQALHDLMATTYVVDKNYQKGQILPELTFSKGGLIASILAAVGPIVLYVVSILIAIIALAISDLKDNGDMKNPLDNSNHKEVTSLMKDSNYGFYIA